MSRLNLQSLPSCPEKANDCSHRDCRYMNTCCYPTDLNAVKVESSFEGCCVNALNTSNDATYNVKCNIIWVISLDFGNYPIFNPIKPNAISHYYYLYQSISVLSSKA